ncbi:MAG: hypothetical protein BJ554DRAFT_6807 [Olpidium bornovanus]|uniref:Uncharacterized protein n=1 Tax=Olpidium bornovanus TaxID=278681 RepID=A0A8H7ZXM1_9FUNG|nr:MAG: hypothetical protein BJ554DRAFT_6807 [Olpidium bornovanus]
MTFSFPSMTNSGLAQGGSRPAGFPGPLRSSRERGRRVSEPNHGENTTAVSGCAAGALQVQKRSARPWVSSFSSLPPPVVSLPLQLLPFPSRPGLPSPLFPLPARRVSGRRARGKGLFQSSLCDCAAVSEGEGPSKIHAARWFPLGARLRPSLSLTLPLSPPLSAPGSQQRFDALPWRGGAPEETVKNFGFDGILPLRISSPRRERGKRIETELSPVETKFRTGRGQPVLLAPPGRETRLLLSPPVKPHPVRGDNGRTNFPVLLRWDCV